MLLSVRFYAAKSINGLKIYNFVSILSSIIVWEGLRSKKITHFWILCAMKPKYKNFKVVAGCRFVDIGLVVIRESRSASYKDFGE